MKTFSKLILITSVTGLIPYHRSDLKSEISDEKKPCSPHFILGHFHDCIPTSIENKKSQPQKTKIVPGTLSENDPEILTVKKDVFEDLIAIAFAFKGTPFGRKALNRVLNEALEENLKKATEKTADASIDASWRQIIF